MTKADALRIGLAGALVIAVAYFALLPTQRIPSPYAACLENAAKTKPEGVKAPASSACPSF